jgi:hypothetical protein
VRVSRGVIRRGWSVAVGCAREAHFDLEPSIQARVDVERRVVSVGDSGDDRQPEAHAFQPVGDLHPSQRKPGHANLKAASGHRQPTAARRRYRQRPRRRAQGALGGAAGLLLGTLATLTYALAQHEPMIVPGYALAAAPAAGFAIGMISGLYPAAKAARLSRTEALGTS